MPEPIRIGELSNIVKLHVNTLRRLADNGEIPMERTAGGQRLFNVNAVLNALEMRSKVRHPSGRITTSRDGSANWQKEFRLENLQEHEVWNELVIELNLDLSCGAGDIFPYAFTEMLNNAIEHSEGTIAKIRFWVNSGNWAFEIVDDGLGAFEKIRSKFNLDGPISQLTYLNWPRMAFNGQ
jgi:excisionase family DNA binding protein